MKIWLSGLVLACGLGLLGEVRPTDPMTLGMAVATLAVGGYFLVAGFLASPSPTWAEAALKTGVRAAFCLVSLFCLLTVASPFQRDRDQARQKACMANLRLILGAVEMYNMDATGALRLTTLETTDVASGGWLVTAGWLKSPIVPPTPQCDYRGTDLAGLASLSCAFHGSLEHPRPPPAVPLPLMALRLVLAAVGAVCLVVAIPWFPFLLAGHLFRRSPP
ncbi:MAG: hypothetical protein GX442_22220 [Candidatus Riflebacteria bacterium]|nr:hypothetical protein [Candidatus Riflebacteria bacterium]